MVNGKRMDLSVMCLNQQRIMALNIKWIMVMKMDFDFGLEWA